MKKNRLPLLLLGLMILSVSVAVLTSVIAVEDTSTVPSDAAEPIANEGDASAGQGKYEVKPDTWVFTDALGRTSLTNAEVGDPREDKTLAMFYWTWHTSEIGADEQEPLNVNNYVEEHPEIKNDYDNPLWPTTPTAYFWNEPIFGYYRGSDEWVVRRQGELLANAGIDVIFTDNTNGAYVWKESYDVVFETWSQAMKDGVNTPKVSFMLPFVANAATNKQLHLLYDDIYGAGKYQELWFYWEGKPMIMAHPSELDLTDREDAKIYTFFTFRNNFPNYAYPLDKTIRGQWGWLSTYPQALYYGHERNEIKGIVEQTTVGTALNHSFVTNQGTAMNGVAVMGRSYTSNVSKGGTPYPTDPNSKYYGYNFAEQFEYALDIDPKVIFVTGWNEWTAGRHENWGYVENAFPDEFNDEYSRDIEPTRGDLGDCYYYQLVNYARQYKGVRAIPEAGEATTIDIKGGVEQWDAVEPFFAAYQGNTDDRDSKGYGSTYYTDYSGRNDIIGAQVARDEDMVYFMVECAEDITPYTDALWMVLYIDCDQNNRGWETFDYVINKTSPSATHAALEKFVNGYESEIIGTVEYTVDGRYMQVAVPKSMLGLEGYDFTINFSWTDNVHDWDDHGTISDADGSVVYSEFSGDILDFYTSGDVAPGMRFKYSYISTEENAIPTVEIESDSETESETEATDGTTAPETEAVSTGMVQEAGCKSSVVGLLPVTAMLVTAGVCLRKRKKEHC